MARWSGNSWHEQVQYLQSASWRLRIGNCGPRFRCGSMTATRFRYTPSHLPLTRSLTRLPRSAMPLGETCSSTRRSSRMSADVNLIAVSRSTPTSFYRISFAPADLGQIGSELFDVNRSTDRIRPWHERRSQARRLRVPTGWCSNGRGISILSGLGSVRLLRHGARVRRTVCGGDRCDQAPAQAGEFWQGFALPDGRDHSGTAEGQHRKRYLTATQGILAVLEVVEPINAGAIS